MLKPFVFLSKYPLFALFIVLPVWAAEHTYVEPKSANDVWSDMTEAAVNQHHRRTYVRDAAVAPAANKIAGPPTEEAGRYVMFGGEKEGSSSLITKVMGPSNEGFKNFLKVAGDRRSKQFITEEARRIFLVEFMSGIASGKYITRDVVFAADGTEKKLDLTKFKNQNFNEMKTRELKHQFHLFLEQTEGRSFSFLTSQVRKQIYDGTFPGLTPETGLKKKPGVFNTFKPHFGEAEKFLDAAHGTSVGWEINFLPQRSYGEFEYMNSWFRNSLKNAGQLFEAPGHQWIVYPKTKRMLEDADHAMDVISRVNEIHKNNQAYIVLKALEGDAKIEYSSHKAVHVQKRWMKGLPGVEPGRWDWDNNPHSTDRGVIRLENNRFQVDGAESLAVEFRAGTKSDPIRRTTQKFLISRYAAQEFDDIAPVSSWTLIKGNVTTTDLRTRFNLTETEATNFFQKLSGLSRARGTRTKPFNKSYLVPFWQWEDAPYLSASKKVELRRLTEAFVRTINDMPNPTADSVSEAMISWAKSSNLSADIENYLRPKPRLAVPEEAARIALPEGARVNVNNVDVGIEYTARFPLKTDAEYVDIKNQPGKTEWLRTSFEYTPEERKNVLKRAAQSIAKEQNGGVATAVEFVSSGDGHGHGLDLAYEFKDGKDRKWRVEWDGIGRSYDTNGKMIPDSLRGGHIEIVTPKFNPTPAETEALFRALKKESLIPATRFGGGHVNVDLAPFEGKPKALARFLGTYYDNRNMMTMMFQHPGRGVGAEPNRMSQSLINKLKAFDGTEEDLKKLLYNEKFFNTRVGRKTKNNQLNMIAYFQDVIPEEFVHQDFDMKNDMWRRTFDVNPKIRKMEFRMFNAPRNAAESALQIKFVRAMMNKALNEDTPVFRGNYVVDTGALSKNPEAAEKEFFRVMNELHLDPVEYRSFYTEGLSLNHAHVNNPKALTNKQKLALHPEVRDWGHASEARAVPIGSEGRVWAGNDILPEARKWKQAQQTARVEANSVRARLPASSSVSKLSRTSGDAIVSGNGCRPAASIFEDLLR